MADTEQEMKEEAAPDAQAAEKKAKGKEKAAKPAIKAIEKLDPNAMVCVRSGHDGTVRYRGKDGSLYIWERMGVEQFMTVAELRYIASAKSRFISEGWLQVDDPLVIERKQCSARNTPIEPKFQAVAVPDVADIGSYFERGFRLAAATTYSACGTIGAEIASVAAVGQNKSFALLESVVQGAAVAPGTFTYDPATKELLFDPADVPADTRIAVTYRRTAQVGLLENDATRYAATDRWVIDALGKDPCGKEYRVQIDANQVDVSGTFTLDIGDTQTVQNVEGRCVKSGCGGSDSLYKIKVIGLE